MHNNVILNFVWIASAAFLPHVTSLQVTLEYSLETGQSACPEENITFTCIVKGAHSLLWSSDEYIGPGEELDFTTEDQKGRKQYSDANPDTYATLINVVNSGEVSLESELHIRSNQSSRVSCKTGNAGSKQSYNFTVLGDDRPGMPQDPAAVEIPSDSPQVRCAILIKWDPPNNINSLDLDHYVVHTSTQSEMDTVNETSTLAAFLSPCTELSSLYINITAVDRCQRVGVTTANFQPSIQPSISTTSTPVPYAEYSMIVAAVSAAISLSVLLGICCLCILGLCICRNSRKTADRECGEVAGVSISKKTEESPRVSSREDKEARSNSTERSPLNNSGSSSTGYGGTLSKSADTKQEETS